MAMTRTPPAPAPTPTAPVPPIAPTVDSSIIAWAMGIITAIVVVVVIFLCGRDWINSSSNSSHSGETARLMEEYNVTRVVSGKISVDKSMIGKKILFRIPNYKPETNNFFVGNGVTFLVKVIADAKFESDHPKYGTGDSSHTVKTGEGKIPEYTSYGKIYKNPKSNQDEHFLLLYDIENI
jgi:hypothetical protein